MRAVFAFLRRIIPSNVEVSPIAARYAISGAAHLGSMNGVDHSNGNADSVVLSERGRQAHVAKLPMTYFRPIMEMLKDPWCVATRPDINANRRQTASGVMITGVLSLSAGLPTTLKAT